MLSSSRNLAGLLTLVAASTDTFPIRHYTPPLYRARLARSGDPDAADLERLSLAQAKRERKQQKRVQDMLRVKHA